MEAKWQDIQESSSAENIANDYLAKDANNKTRKKAEKPPSALAKSAALGCLL